MSNNLKTLLLIDGDCISTIDSSMKVYWASREVPPGDVSLLDLVEKTAEKLRAEYLAWCYEFGEYFKSERRLFSDSRKNSYSLFWSMSLLAEKSILKCHHICILFKLRALEDYIVSQKIKKLVLYSYNKDLLSLIKKFCQDLKLDFSFIATAPLVNRKEKQVWWKSLPHCVQAALYWSKELMAYLRYYNMRPAFSNSPHQLTIVNYHPNIDNELASNNVYYSNYWGDVHELLSKSQVCNWVWIYAKNEYHSLGQSVKMRDRFLIKNARNEKFFFMDEFQSWRSWPLAIIKYLRLCCNSYPSKELKNRFKFSGSRINYWHLLRNDWFSSFTGKVAMENCLRVIAFNHMTKLMPQQQQCVFIWEGQGWEKALVQAWRKNQKTHVSGYQHSCLAYFDVRHYQDPRYFTSQAAKQFYPDQLNVNGKSSWNLLKEAGIPEQKLHMVEAARFSYLAYQLNMHNLQQKKTTLLVLTGYNPQLIEEQLKLLNDAMDGEIAARFQEFIIKPHPYQSLGNIINLYPNLDMFKIEHKPLTNLLNDAAVVYLDNHTTAAIEVALFGVPTIIHVANDVFNLSPLYHPKRQDLEQVYFVSTVERLRKSMLNKSTPKPVDNDYFCFDSSFKRWKSLVENEASIS